MRLFTEPFYRNSISIILNTLFSSIFGLLFWVIAARNLAATDLGLATTAVSAATLIVIISRFGLDMGLIRYVPSSEYKNSMNNTVLITTLMSSIIITIIFLMFINWFSPSLSFLTSGIILFIFIIYIAFASINQSQFSAFIALRRADLMFLQNLILGFRLPILFLIATLGIVGIFISYVLASFLALTFGLIILAKFKFFFKPEVNFEILKGMTKFSFGNYTANIFTSAPITIVSILIVSVLGADQSAYFYIAFSLACLPLMIPTAVATSLFVEGSHNIPLRENLKKSVIVILILLVPTVLVFILLGDKILLLFNKEYSLQSFEVLKLLSIASLFSAGPTIYVAIKNIQKDILTVNLINMSTFLLIIALSFMLIFKFELIGLGYAWVLGYAIMFIYVVWRILFRDKLTLY